MLYSFKKCIVDKEVTAKFYLIDANNTITLMVNYEKKNNRIIKSKTLREVSATDIEEANKLLDIAEKIKDDNKYAFEISKKELND